MRVGELYPQTTSASDSIAEAWKLHVLIMRFRQQIHNRCVIQPTLVNMKACSSARVRMAQAIAAIGASAALMAVAILGAGPLEAGHQSGSSTLPPWAIAPQGLGTTPNVALEAPSVVHHPHLAAWSAKADTDQDAESRFSPQDSTSPDR